MFGVVPLACNEIETEIYALDIVRDPNDYYVRSFSFDRREQKREREREMFASYLFDPC